MAMCHVSEWKITSLDITEVATHNYGSVTPPFYAQIEPLTSRVRGSSVFIVHLHYWTILCIIGKSHLSNQETIAS